MKIRSKFMLLQLVIIAGFLLSMAFVVLRFSQGYFLKVLEYDGVKSMTELKTLMQKTSYFSGRTEALDFLWSDWLTSYQRFDRQYSDMLSARGYRLMGKEALVSRDARLQDWSAIRIQEVQALTQSIESILSSPIIDDVGENGIIASLELIGNQAGSSDPGIGLLTDLEAQFQNLHASLADRVLGPTDAFITDLRTRVSRYSQALVLITLVIALIIQSGALALVLRFSRRFSRHVVQLEQSFAQVIGGNFDIGLSIQSGDEFEQIAQHFKSLIQGLWNRLESMKEMMRDIGNSTSDTSSMEDLEEFILKLAMENTGAEAGMLMTMENSALLLRQSHGYFPPPMDIHPKVAVKREYVVEWFKTHPCTAEAGLIGEVYTSGEARFIKDNRNGELASNADPESDLYINSAILIPIKTAHSLYGVLALAFTGQKKVFTDLDYFYMRTYGQFISLTVDNMLKYLDLAESQKINKDIEVAANIQKALQPEKMPNIEGAQVAAFSNAAKGVSGDYFDTFDLGNHKTAVVICDVAGKGVPASLLMIMIRTILRSISGPDKRSDQILTELNQAITGRIGTGRYATISIIILDSLNNTISYSNGAHHPLYILRSDTMRYHKFDTDGLPMGIDRNAGFGHRIIQIRSNDYLVLFTDGLPEARNNRGEELGTNRLLRCVAEHCSRSPEDLSHLVKHFVNEFTAGCPQHDDQTFLALKVS